MEKQPVNEKSLAEVDAHVARAVLLRALQTARKSLTVADIVRVLAQMPQDPKEEDRPRFNEQRP